MSQLVLSLHVLRTLAANLHRRATGDLSDDPARDRGVSTLEIVVIALGLFLVAGVLVAALTGAINTRLAQIN